MTVKKLIEFLQSCEENKQVDICAFADGYDRQILFVDEWNNSVKILIERNK